MIWAQSAGSRTARQRRARSWMPWQVAARPLRRRVVARGRRVGPHSWARRCFAGRAAPCFDSTVPPGTNCSRGRSANFREQVRRRERKLRREHEVRFRLSDDPERLDDDLDILFSLHGARWKGGGDLHVDLGAVPPRIRLLRAGARLAPPLAARGRRRAGRGLVRLPLRRCRVVLPGGAGPCVVALVGRFRAPRAHDSGRRSRTASANTGFSRAAEEYKYRFTREDPGLETIGLARSAAGAAAVGAARTLGRRPSLAALARHVVKLSAARVTQLARQARARPSSTFRSTQTGRLVRSAYVESW